MKITVETLKQKKKSGEKIVALTAYDYITAKLLDEVGIDLILVGDSLGMVVLGEKDTLKVTVDQMLHHTQAVTRGVKQALVVADMPFLSYGVQDEATILNAGRFIQGAHAHAVKLEGGESHVTVIKKMVDLGIPVLGHIGMTPTHILTQSGYRVQGKTDEEATRLMRDAKALEGAGVFGLVLECVPSGLASEITHALSIPTIGIGAGGGCDGQILVSHDLLGLYEEFQPKFVRRYADLAHQMRKAFEAYREDVLKKKFPGKDESYR